MAKPVCERALEEKPDLILLDIMMPQLDGFAVCAELRRLGNPSAGSDAHRQRPGRGPGERPGRRRG